MSFYDPKLAALTKGGLTKGPQTYSPETYGPKSDAKRQEELITSHLPLVRKLAWHVKGRMSNGLEIEDLLQIGMVALVEAAQGYEDRGLGFSNYAKLRVRGAMIDHLRKLSQLSRMAMAFRKKLRGAQAKLSQQLGHEPTEQQLAHELGMTAEEYRAAVDGSDSSDIQSMDEVYSDHNIWFSDQSERADDALEASQMQDQMGKAIASLPEREAMVLQLYFVEEMNLDEIGQTLDIGAARVCQIKKAALEKVKAILVEA